LDSRDFAVLTLDSLALPGLVREAFKRRSPVPPTDTRDRALAEAIVTAVVKNLRLLDTHLGHHAKRPTSQIDGRARLILLVALAQMHLFDRVPDHALVTEAVQQTRRLNEPGLARASGFVNAVLRSAVRRPDLNDVLPTRSNAAAYCEVVLSHPRGLVTKLLDLLGPADAVRFCEHDNREPPTLVRLIGDTTPASFEGDTVTVRPHVQPGLVVVDGAKQADFARWAEAGIGQVQDATSAAVVGELGVGPGMAVLDRCCGVGTKTQQLAEAAGGDGRVVAVDAHGARISLLRRLAKGRPVMANVTAKRAEWRAEFPDDWPDSYDRILIDAPCSNSGVLARRAEARYGQTPVRLGELVELQRKLLADTWPLLSPGGRLAYATCSVWPEENFAVVSGFLASTPGATRVSEKGWLPSFETDDPTRYRDGGYVAVLRKA
jgi:16S rRNA (cytosine967-C5)-methyltransferase